MKKSLFLLLSIFFLFSCDNTIENAKMVKKALEGKLLEDKFLSIEKGFDSTFSANQLKVSQIADSLVGNAEVKTIIGASNYTIEFLQNYKKELNKYVEEEKKNTPLTKDYVFQMQYSLEQKNAYQLEKELENYITTINSLNPKFSFEHIALDADEIKEFKNNPEQNKKDFAQLNFQKTPLLAANAILSQLKLEVVNVELKALEILSEKE